MKTFIIIVIALFNFHFEIKKNLLAPTIILILLVLLNFCKNNDKQSSPQTINGILDLKNWDFQNNGNIKLDGEWEFYPNEFLDPFPLWEADRKYPQKKIIKVPSAWENFQKENGFERIYFGTYRLKILLPNANTYLSIKLPVIGSSYSLYSNGVLIASKGKVGKTKEESTPNNQVGIYDLIHEQEYIEIIVHVSNFVYENGSGLWESIVMGITPEIHKLSKNNTILDAISFGTLFIMAIYHFSFYFLRKKDKAALYFGLLCFAVSIRTILYGEKLILEIPFFEDQYFLTIRLEFFFLYLILPIFIQYIRIIFSEDFGKNKLFNFAYYLGYFFSFIGFFTPISIYTNSFILRVFQIVMPSLLLYLCFRIPNLILKKRDGAKSFSIGILINLFTALNDVLHINKIINTAYLGPLGFISFVFAQSILLASRFSKGYIESEELTKKLNTLNENLETEVKQRTIELEKEKIEIQNLNSMIKQLNESTDPDIVLSDILTQIEKNFGIEGCWLWLYDESNKELYPYKLSEIAKLIYTKEEVKWLTDLRISSNSDSIIAKLLKNPKTFYIQNAQRYFNRFSVIDKELILKLRFQHMLSIPLLIESKTIGLLFFADVRTNTGIDKKIFPSLENYASQIASVIRNASLLKETKEAKEELKAINDFTNLINSYSDLTEIFKSTSKYIYEKFSISSMWLLLPDEKHEFLSTYRAFNYNKIPEKQFDKIMKFFIPMNDEGGLLYLIWKRAKIFYFKKIKSTNNLYDEKIKDFGIESGLVIPLVLYKKPIGLLCFTNINSKFKINSKDLEKISFLCAQITGVINTVNLLRQTQIQKVETEKARNEINFINEFNKKLNSKLDLEWIMDEIYSHAKDKYNFDALFLTLKEGNFLYSAKKRLPSFKIFDEQAMDELNLPLSEEGGLHYLVYKRKKSTFIKDVERYKENLTQFDKKIIELINFQSVLYLPLIIQNECIGIIDLVNTKEKIYLTKDNQKSLEVISESISSAIYNSKLLNETEKQKKETENLNQLIKSLNEELDLQVIMQKVMKYAQENFGFENYALYSVNQEKTHVQLLESNISDFVNIEDNIKIRDFQIPITGDIGAHNFAIKTKRPFYIPNSTSKRVLNGATSEERFTIKISNLQSFIILPLILNNTPIGILDFSKFSSRMSLSKEDIFRLSILAEQLAGIIHGSNLFKQVQEEKEKALIAQFEAVTAKQETENLNQFLKSIQSKENIKEVLDEIQKYIELAFQITNHSLWVYDSKSNTLNFYDGSYPNELAKSKFLKEGNKVLQLTNDGAHALACRSKKPFFVPDTVKRKSNDDEEAENQILLNMNSIFIVPLLVQDKLIGTLDFSHGSKKLKLSKKIQENISIFSGLVAGVIQNFSLLEKVENERQKSEKLLLNILPKDVASELKEKGFAEPTLFEEVTVMFTDFKGFTQIAETLSPGDLIKELDACFVQFDKITERFNLEKLKTIGDSYMCAGGIPKRNKTHAIDCVLAALEIQNFMNLMKKLKEEKGFPYWELRLGIHTGPLVAGVIGEKKFAYDVWGDTVNTASRMESSGTPGKINISGSTYELVKEYFDCEFRGKVNAKNKGEVEMYYVNGLKKEFSKNEDGKTPNAEFWKKIAKIT